MWENKRLFDQLGLSYRMLEILTSFLDGQPAAKCKGYCSNLREFIEKKIGEEICGFFLTIVYMHFLKNTRIFFFLKYFSYLLFGIDNSAKSICWSCWKFLWSWSFLWMKNIEFLHVYWWWSFPAIIIKKLYRFYNKKLTKKKLTCFGYF